MAVYIYSKTTEDISIFAEIMDIINEDDQEIFVSVEHKRNFRELDKIKDQMAADDILVVGSLKSLGLNEADIASALEYFIKNEKYLLVANIESTYEFGLAQPMNKAILNTLLESLLVNNANIIQLPRNRKSNSGRNKIDFPENWEALYEAWSKEEISSKEFLDRSGLKKATFYNMITEYKEILKANENFIKKYKLA